MKRLSILLLVLLCVASCHRDDLYYSTSSEATVRFNIDWSRSNITPNGVTLYIYDEQGNLFGQPILSSNTLQVEACLPLGTYSAVLHNNSRSEFQNVEFVDIDRFTSFMVKSRAASHKYFKPDAGDFFALEPEDILSATVPRIDVTEDGIYYYEEKPDLSQYLLREEIDVQMVPKHVVHLAEVRAHIEGAQGVVRVPIAMLHGMSRGYYFGADHTAQERVVEEFPLDLGTLTRMAGIKRTSAPMPISSDDIFIEFNTFGYPFVDTNSGGEPLKLEVELLLFMADGKFYDILVDVTDSVTIEEGENQRKYIITIEDSLDKYTPKEDPELDVDDDLQQGVFDPNVDDWVDVVVPLPMP